MKLYGAIAGTKICGVTQMKLTGLHDPILVTNDPPTLADGSQCYVSIGDYSILGLVPGATPMANWVALHGVYSKADFLYVSDRVKEVYAEYVAAGIDISELPDGEKSALLEYLAANPSDLLKVFSQEQLQEATGQYLSESSKVRFKRYEAVKTRIVTNFGIDGAKSISKDLKANNEIEQYQNEADDGLIDYLNSVNDYDGAGFLENSAVVASGRATEDLEGIRDDAIAILILGTTSADKFYLA
ncbi:hypothetical protein Xen7305DRAFT_00008190 [Xenococcus sp. PCC 7305]|uniref:hypothetical protein n=1 Tax=Xenococcus sp. PCC 7305 TaxID=102125 RepID=UPI0002ACFAC9|nr:hypothetical protein [Xenococcus sp. PCC 7305]ELS01117.1 hypothetical protein Xen7305DRAFT_00008190 [Xenococcus sp. PCC 7305]